MSVTSPTARLGADRFNAADYLLHRHCGEGRGNHVAVRSPSSELTYAALSNLVRRVCASYRVLGMRRDDRVLLVGADDVPMLAAILGAFGAGLVAVPVSTMLTGAELGKIIADSGARLVLCTEEFAEAVTTGLEDAPAVDFAVHHGDRGNLAARAGYAGYDWDSFLALADGADVAAQETESTTEDSWALWLYTSGTTGLSKGAMHRHANIRHVCETYGRQVLGIEPDDRTLSVAKLFFAYGIGNSLFLPFAVGATTMLEPRRPTPQVIAERLQRDRPTLFFGVPTFYAALVASEIPEDAFASTRWCVSAGEPLPAPLHRRFTDRFGVEVLDGLGSTEALHIFLSNRPGDIRSGTTGRPVPGYDVEVRDGSGAVVPPGEPGALYVRGESIALGYWRRTAASRQVFQGAWLSTGDTYVCDDAGYYRCLGRSSDMLKAGGIWVSPAEVESRLLEHVAVREAAVVGVADEEGLEKPVAVVVADGASAGELISWCRDGLAHFKAPRQVLFVDELPRTGTGKLQRFKVRDFLAESQSVTVPAT